MKQLFYALLIAALAACNSQSDDQAGSGGGEVDTGIATNPGTADPVIKPFTGRGESDEESKERRAIIFMAIDSTYFAIHAIEDIKNDLSLASAVNLSLPERNLRSKALLKMNAIQNSLARQIDSALLVNLKLHTAELANINTSITTNIAHLKNLSAQLSKLSMIMGRLTEVLSFCISRGLVKPPTPVQSNPDEVKNMVN